MGVKVRERLAVSLHDWVKEERKRLTIFLHDWVRKDR